jgi:sporulation-control protein
MSLLSRIGIGAATVDFVPRHTTVQPGGYLDAHIEVRGGSAQQHVDEIEVAVMTQYLVEGDEEHWRHHALRQTELTGGFTIEPEAEETFEAPPLEIPHETPVTIGSAEVWIQTGLDIDWSRDPQDRDHLDVEPTPPLQALFDAVEGLGFRLQSAGNKKAHRGAPTYPLIQEFEYRPAGGPYADELDELELYPYHEGDLLRVGFQVDRSGIGIFGSDESYNDLTLDTDDSAEAEQQLRAAIDSYL